MEEAPDTLDVVGAAEAAEILGVEPGRISVWRAAKRLPPPYSTPKCSPVWLRVDIERFRDGARDGFTVPPRQMPLLGTREFARLVGVDKSQIGRWRRTPPASAPPIPPPAVQITAGPLWTRQDALEFALARRIFVAEPRPSRARVASAN